MKGWKYLFVACGVLWLSVASADPKEKPKPTTRVITNLESLLLKEGVVVVQEEKYLDRFYDHPVSVLSHELRVYAVRAYAHDNPAEQKKGLRLDFEVSRDPPISLVVIYFDYEEIESLVATLMSILQISDQLEKERSSTKDPKDQFDRVVYANTPRGEIRLGIAVGILLDGGVTLCTIPGRAGTAFPKDDLQKIISSIETGIKWLDKK